MSKATDLIASSDYSFLDRHSSSSATQKRTSSAVSSRTTDEFDYGHAQETIRKAEKAEDFLKRKIERKTPPRSETTEKKLSSPPAKFSSPKIYRPLVGAIPPEEKIPDRTLVDRTINAGNRFPEDVSLGARDELLNRSRDPKHFLHTPPREGDLPPRSNTQLREQPEHQEAVKKLLDDTRSPSPVDRT
jgi:hypothetical protein